MKDKADSFHICLLGPEYSKHTERWVNSLRQRGHRVDLVTFNKDPHSSLGGISLDARSKMAYVSKIRKLRTIINTLQPDIVHAHYASSYGFLASFVDHPRKIVSVWGDDIAVFPTKNFLFKYILRRSLRKADRITCTSEFLRQLVISNGYGHKNIAVIPFGIDFNRFCYVSREAKPIVRFGIAKSFLPKYGIDYLLRAFKKLVDSGCKVELKLIGEGTHEKQYKNLASELGLSEQVKFSGIIDNAKMPSFYESIDIFVMPSVSDGESFGVAAVEAAATGLPVIATRVGGVPEVVIDGTTGYLVERRNVEQLAAAMRKLIDEPALRIKMGKAGRENVEKKYRWENNVRAMENVYREIMN